MDLSGGWAPGRKVWGSSPVDAQRRSVGCWVLSTRPKFTQAVLNWVPARIKGLCDRLIGELFNIVHHFNDLRYFLIILVSKTFEK